MSLAPSPSPIRIPVSVSRTAATSRSGYTVSVVVPVLNEATVLPSTLASIAEQDGAMEILIVDGGSTDDTPSIAEAKGARVISSRPGRGVQLRAGAREARGNVLLFLHADTRLPSGALPAMLELFNEPSVVGGRFRIRFPHRHPLLSVIAFLSRFPWSWTSYGDSGFFVRRSVYDAIGGFEELPLLEDLRFFRRLKKAGRVSVLPLPVITSCRRFCRRGPWRQLLVNIGLLASYCSGTSIVTIADRYAKAPPACPSRTSTPASRCVRPDP